MIWNSRRVVILLALSAGLTGCGSSSTPLSDALAALRAGDRTAFLAAKERAVEIMKTAKTVAQTRCGGLDPTEFRKRNEMLAIANLDRESLFAKGEDERLVYALNVAGYLKSDSAFLEAVLNYDSNAGRCPPLDAKQKADFQAATSKDQDMERARQNVLADWVSAKKREYGQDTFESNMRSAANRLTNVGLSSKWPTKVILADSD
jgi:hypothetical protein